MKVPYFQTNSNGHYFAIYASTVGNNHAVQTADVTDVAHVRFLKIIGYFSVNTTVH